MSTMLPCPDAQTLKRLLLAPPAGLDDAALEQHLAECLSCVAVLESAPRSDTLMRTLQDLGPAETLRDPPAVTQVVRRAEALLEGAPAPGSVRAAHDDADATGAVSARSTAFPFLSPPQQPDEIGRLDHFRVLRKLGEGG